MKLAFITPTAYLNKYSKQGDIYLALAHLIDDEGRNEYARFHRRAAEQGGRVILDNGLFEGAQVSTEQLIQRARAVKAQVVCAPDVLFDTRGTIKAFKQFIKAKHDEGLVCDVMGIPQADNPSDWWDCFQFMDLHPECRLIGLSILSIPKSFRSLAEGVSKYPITASRMHLIRQLYAYSDISGHRITPCHLLGLGEHYGDIITANRLLARDIVSNDSSSAFVHGMARVRYTSIGGIPGGKIPEKLDFGVQYGSTLEAPRPGEKYNDSQKGLMARFDAVQHNIDVAKWIARKDW